MRAAFVRLLLVGSLLACAASASGAEVDDLAAAVRTALAQRDLPGAKIKLDELKGAAATQADKDTADRLDLLYGYLFDFWKSVHQGGQKLLGAEEIMIGDKRVAVVEYDVQAGKLVIRSEGENKRYTLFDMPPRVALTLSAQVAKPDVPQNQAYIGAFLAMDSRGDRKLAADAWQRAQQGGVDVKSLLPELKIPLPAAATIQLPKLTPQTAALLRPQFWQLAVQGEKGWKRAPLGKLGQQNPLGRLEVNPPAEAQAVWLTFGRKLPVNFGVRMYFDDLPEGQRLGLFNDKAEEAADAYVELPAGRVKVEFARRSGALVCRINDEEKTVTVADKMAAATSGVLGISLIPGTKLEVAGCEFAP